MAKRKRPLPTSGAPKARRRIGQRKSAERPAGRLTPKRRTGAQHRKLARVRATTSPDVAWVLLFVAARLWVSVDSRPYKLLSVDQDSDPRVRFSPTIAEVWQEVVAFLESVKRWRGGDPAVPQVPENAFLKATAAAVDHHQKGEPIEFIQPAMQATQTCHRTLLHLAAEERWRNLYQCTSCGRWFLAKHTPHTKKPYCDRRCWPSRQVPDRIAPPRRVQSSPKTPR